MAWLMFHFGGLSPSEFKALTWCERKALRTAVEEASKKAKDQG